MADDVELKLQRCLPCLKRKKNVPDRAPLVNIITTQPMELVCVDFLSLEPSTGGVENILVITDHFTRLAHAVPCKNQTAKTTAQALYNFFLIYWFPLQLLSDQGRNFMSKTIKELCKLAGIKQSRTTPYHAMGNGRCERMNSTLLNMLGCLTDEQKANWKKYVPTVVHAYNCTKHESTKQSPFYLMFGRHPRLPIDVAMGVEKQDDLEVDFTQTLKDRLDVAYTLATKESERAAARHKTHYDKKVRGSSVKVGDRVLVKNVGVRGKSKLANVWEDDIYMVEEQPDESIPVFVVRREDKKGGKRTLHRNLLLPVNFLPLSIPRKEKKRVKTLQKEPLDDKQLRSESSSSESEASEGDEEPRYFLRHRMNPDAPAFIPRAERVDDVVEDVGIEGGSEEEEVEHQHVDNIEPDVVSEEEEAQEVDDVQEPPEDVPASPAGRTPPPVPAPRVLPPRNRRPTQLYGNPVSHQVHAGSSPLVALAEFIVKMNSEQLELFRTLGEKMDPDALAIMFGFV